MCTVAPDALDPAWRPACISVFGYVPHGVDEKPPSDSDSVGRLRLRLEWHERKRRIMGLDQEDDNEIEFVVIGDDARRPEPPKPQGSYNDRGLKAALSPT